MSTDATINDKKNKRPIQGVGSQIISNVNAKIHQSPVPQVKQ